MGCSECDIDEREKQYKKHLDRQKVYENAARNLEGYYVDGNRIIHENVSEVNIDAITYRRFAEMKEEHGVEPKQFVMMVLEKARVIPLD